MDVRTLLRGNKSKRSRLIGAALVFLTILIVAVALAGCGNQSSPPTSNAQSEPAVSLVPGLSADQSRMVNQLGYPEQFFVSYDPSGSTRMETWSYPSKGKSSDFSDGRLLNQGTLEDQSTEYPPTTLHPQDFTQTMTVEEASRILGEPIYSQDVEDSLMSGKNTVVVFNSAILQFRSGELLSMDTQVKAPEIPAAK